jgi:protein O-GlcNAc transferase
MHRVSWTLPHRIHRDAREQCHDFQPMNDRSSDYEALQRIGQLAAVGRLDEAWAECKSLIIRAPGDSSGWTLFGQLSLQRGLLSDAEMAFRQVANLSPRDASAWNWLSIAQRGQGRLAEAEASARQAIALDPSPAIHWTNLANALALQAKWDQAAAAFRESLARQPGDAEIWCDLGVVEHRLRRLDAAQAAYERSLALEPGRLGTLTNWSYLLLDCSEWEPALTILNEIVRRDPRRVTAWVAIGNACQRMYRFREAERAYRQALDLEPGHLEAAHNLGQSLAAQGMAAEAAEQLKSTLAIRPDMQLHAQLLQILSYVDSMDSIDLLRAHQQWAASYADPLAPRTQLRQPGRGTPLRLGFVSADFGQHPLAFLVLPALENLDKSRCFVACYSERRREDEYTARFRATADLWRQTTELSDGELAEQIGRDEIDILFDLMGHTGKRLLVFARRAAPMQVTWLGYVGTTGLKTIDYLLADRFHVAPGEEDRYVEKVLRMPNGYVCYGPPRDMPGVGPLPVQTAGRFTFGCFNHPAKYSPSVIAAWAEILRRVPTARLLLKYRGFDQPEFGDDIHARFAQRYIPPNRVLLEGHTPLADHLAAYHRVDLALDTQPFSGCTTTCESLWMGVPVVTLPGATFASRQSTSHMKNAGFPSFVADNMNAYVESAVNWASRLDELAVIRSELRDQASQSPLGDAQRFADDLLAVLTQAWEAAAAGK